MDIKHYYENTQLTLQQIADTLGVGIKVVFNYVKRNYSSSYRKARKVANYSSSKMGNKNPMTGKTLEQHPRYVGVVSDGKGYLLVVKPSWYTGRKGSHHVFQHHVVVCEAEDMTQIPKGFVVHHCDKNPQNNSYDNLLLMRMEEHSAWHSSQEGATTISKESTAKWLEARRAGYSQDIVYSMQECIAACKSGQDVTTPVEYKEHAEHAERQNVPN